MQRSRFGSKAGRWGASRARADGSDRADDVADGSLAPADLESVSTGDAADRATETRSERLEHARKLMNLAADQRTTVAPRTPAVTGRPDATQSPCEDADPFEPFEQCAPSAEEPAEQPDSVYTRTSQRVRKTSANDVKSKRPPRSLKGRALGYLSRREYSRAELSRKLKPYVGETDSLDDVLDNLERDGWLSNERFVESVVHRRATRMGGKRIINELKQHAVGDALISETAGQLAQTETARAQAVWQKKFGTPPDSPAERAKQARFLAARGFSGSTIGKILKGGEEDLDGDYADD
jgi:regulatory protein